MSSSTGTPTGGASEKTAASQSYYCHRCQRAVDLSPSPLDLSCPTCHDFLEEIEPPPPNPNPISLSPSPDSLETRRPDDLFGLFGAAPTVRPSAGDPAPFDPPGFLQNHMLEPISNGANIQIVVESENGGELVEFELGPELERIFQLFVENEPTRYGNPPAAKSAVASLPDVKITAELVESDEAQCAVCNDTFEVGDEAKQIQCQHIYHKDCILPWLELHNSCPVCRYELPTDDPDYEQRRRGTTGSAVPTAAGTEENEVGDLATTGGSSFDTFADENSAGQPIVLVRSFRMSLSISRRPFRSSGSQEDSVAGNANTHSSNQGDGGSPTHDEEMD